MLPRPLFPDDALLAPGRIELVEHVVEEVVHVECDDDEVLEHVVEVDEDEDTVVVVLVAGAEDCTGNRRGTSPLKSNCSSFSSRVSSCCTGEDKATLRL